MGLGKKLKKVWNKYKNTIIGTVGGGLTGTVIGGAIDYSGDKQKALAREQEKALAQAEALAERERSKTTITDENSIGSDLSDKKKRKRSLLAGASKGNEIGVDSGATLLGSGGAGKKKLGE